MTGELVVAQASVFQLIAALRKKLWAKTILRLVIKLYGAVGVGIALSYLLAKKKEVKGKTVLITGSAGGLGKSMAFEFAKRGAKRVVLWDIAEDMLAATQKEIQAAHPQSEILMAKVDISKMETIYAAADDLMKQVGFVDVVVNNAGILGGKPFMQLDEKRIRMLFDVNTMALFWMTKKFLPPMLEKKEGHIVVVSSCAAYFPTANSTDYCASKAAAKAFTDALRLEMKCYKQPGVKTLCVCPAGMNTALFKGQKSIPGLATMETADVAVSIVDAVQSQKETLICPWPFPHMGIMNFAMMPVWFGDMCSMSTMDTITTVDLTQANAIFDKMEAGRK